MRIGRVSMERTPNFLEISAVVTSDTGTFPTTKIWFRIPAAHAALVDEVSANAFVAATYYTAMAVGEEIYHESPVSPTLAGNLAAITRTLLEWPATDSWRLRPRFTALKGPSLSSGVREAAGAVASFFTLGVDSFFTLLTEPALTHLVYVVGYDVPLDRQPLRDEVVRRVKEVAVRAGRRHVVVETNLRDFTDPHVSWEENHGSALAAVGLLLGVGLERVHMPSSDASITRAPYGTHPDIDPLWSSCSTQFNSHGTGCKRLDKIRRIAGDLLFRLHVRPCWVNSEQRYNCLRCAKCLRTMLQLRACGQLEACPALAGAIAWHVLDEMIEPRHRWFIWEDLLQTFAADADGREARARVAAMLERSRAASAEDRGLQPTSSRGCTDGLT